MVIHSTDRESSSQNTSNGGNYKFRGTVKTQSLWAFKRGHITDNHFSSSKIKTGSQTSARHRDIKIAELPAARIFNDFRKTHTGLSYTSASYQPDDGHEHDGLNRGYQEPREHHLNHRYVLFKESILGYSAACEIALSNSAQLSSFSISKQTQPAPPNSQSTTPPMRHLSPQEVFSTGYIFPDIHLTFPKLLASLHSLGVPKPPSTQSLPQYVSLAEVCTKISGTSFSYQSNLSKDHSSLKVSQIPKILAAPAQDKCG